MRAAAVVSFLADGDDEQDGTEPASGTVKFRDDDIVISSRNFT